MAASKQSLNTILLIAGCKRDLKDARREVRKALNSFLDEPQVEQYKIDLLNALDNYRECTRTLENEYENRSRIGT